MRRTVTIPDELAARVDEYLELQRTFEPGLTFSAFARRWIEKFLAAQRRSPISDPLGAQRVEPDDPEPDQQGRA